MALKLEIEMITSAKVDVIIGTKHGTIQRLKKISTLNSVQQLAQISTKRYEKSLSCQFLCQENTKMCL